MDAGPWTQAKDVLWRNNDLDERRFARREALCRTQARQFKLSENVQFGRTYGLGSRLYEWIRQKKLKQQLGPHLTSEHW
jgi:hypothetical protein